MKRLFVVDTINFAILSQMILDDVIQNLQEANIVRAFEEAPDTIFLGYHKCDQAKKSLGYYFKVLSQLSSFDCDEIHGGPIVEIHVMSWGGKYVIFTSSKDCHVRAFTIENGNDVKL